MNTLTLPVILLTAVLAGCATFGADPPPIASQQAQCDQQRGGGPWIPSAGICLRGGGGGS
jgi:hypothetical protein